MTVWLMGGWKGWGGWIIKTYHMLPLCIEEMFTGNCEKNLEFKRELFNITLKCNFMVFFFFKLNNEIKVLWNSVMDD